MKCELARGPRNAANVGFVACGGTKVIRETLFELGLQNREKEFLTEYADFLADYVAIIQKRNQAFFACVADMRRRVDEWLKGENLPPEVTAYLEKVRQRSEVVEEALRAKMEMYEGENTPEQHMARADRDVQRLKELLDTNGTEVFAECEDIIDQCNRLAWGHAEVMGMRFSMLARDWAQECALGCANVPAAADYAKALRATLREALNNAPPW